uniref:Uncharacterized protein n=1 Tax=Lepeophtheirus salmonis TaxID=72036 RepID=A0A0K2TBM6_LEPSM
MIEHSYAKTHGTSNKEDYSYHEAQNSFLSDIFIQEAPEIEVLSYVPCSNCINLVVTNESLSAKIQNLEAKLARNRASMMSTKKSRKKISKKA